MENTRKNNKVTLVGEIISDFTFNHQSGNTKYYSSEIAITRTSNFVDYIPLVVSEKLIDLDHDYKGEYVSILGRYSSYNDRLSGTHKLKLYVYIDSIEVIDILSEPTNHIYLEGYICKVPVYRKTPLYEQTERRITDIFVAVQRNFRNSDYIPCICWNSIADEVANYEVGTHIKLHGRIQSREYIKKLSDTDQEARVAYEVSVSKIQIINDKDEHPVNKEEIWMSYTEGDEVRYNKTGELGFIKSVDETTQTYIIDIDGVEYTVTEDELS